MTKQTLALVALLFALFAAPVLAQDNPTELHPTYVSLQIMQPRVELDDIDFSMRGSVRSVMGGYHFNRYFSAEGAYSDGSMSKAGIDMDLSVLSLRAIGRLSQNAPRGGLALLAGIAYNRFDTETRALGVSASDDEWYPSILGGLEVYSERIFVRATFEQFDIDDADAEAWSVGFGYRF